MINGTKTATSFGAAITERLSGREIAAVTAQACDQVLLLRKGAGPRQAGHKTLVALCRRRSGRGRTTAARGLAEVFRVIRSRPHVIDQCGLVLGTFNKHANLQDSDDMLAELAAQLLDAVGAALAFDPREGGKLIHR